MESDGVVCYTSVELYKGVLGSQVVVDGKGEMIVVLDGGMEELDMGSRAVRMVEEEMGSDMFENVVGCGGYELVVLLGGCVVVGAGSDADYWVVVVG